ncbi:MAG TPA: thiamine pyrophosphate-dependent enzyme [Bacteroidia bacterium]
MPDALASTCDVPHFEETFSLDDYKKGIPRWCPGCGDNSILNSVQRLCKEKQLHPEKTVFVSGIGCSSRFPHYMNTYGFHGLHGRAFPVAEGVKFRRPDLNVFVVTGDGDCCSIGTAHWIHAIRYNMNMTVMLLDNSIYGLTKKQTSPTSAKGTKSNTHPQGSVLPPINPILTTLSVSNVSFVAQTVDWKPAHVFETLKAAHEHPGFSFVRVIQRCPKFMGDLYEEAIANPAALTLLTHEKGIRLDEKAEKGFKNIIEHSPDDINKGREYAAMSGSIPIGLFYQNKNAPRYDEYGAHNLGMPVQDRITAINKELDKYAV